MKSIFLILALSSFTIYSFSQVTTASTKKETAPKTYNIVTPGTYEANIVTGRASISKLQVKENSSNAYTSKYSLVIAADKPEGKEKVIEMKLSKQYFETIFLKASPDISQKSALLTKYVSDRNMPLTDEKDWILLVKYYNSL